MTDPMALKTTLQRFEPKRQREAARKNPAHDGSS